MTRATIKWRSITFYMLKCRGLHWLIKESDICHVTNRISMKKVIEGEQYRLNKDNFEEDTKISTKPHAEERLINFVRDV